MKNRIGYEYGRGAEAAVLDFQKGVRYFSSGHEGLIADFGGKQYYTSCSGISGAGWINRHPRLLPAACYRADRKGWNVKDTKGVSVVVPYWYKDDNNAGMPAFVRKGDDWWACKVPEVLECLRAESSGGEFEFKWTVSMDLENTKEVTMNVPFVGNVEYRDVYRGAMRSVAIERLQCPLLVSGKDDRSSVNATLSFYRLLGFNLVTLVTGKRLFLRTTGENIVLEMWDGVGRHNNPSVEWVDDNTYITRTNSGEAVLVVRGEWESESDVPIPEWNRGSRSSIFEDDFEVALAEGVLVKFYAGEQDALAAPLAEARAGLEQKHQTWLEQIRQADEARQMQEQFRLLCEKHGELEVSVADSIAAGNCQPGTESFRDRSFHGRDSVTVKELARFVSVPGVRRVLEHKLRPFLARIA